MMYLGNDLIEAIQIEASMIQKPGYLGQFKRNLKIKYRDLIRQDADKTPEFLVIPLCPAKPDASG